MKKLTNNLKNMAFIAVMFFTITACDSNDGPLEKAGKSIDNTATDMGNKVEDACEDAKKGLNMKDTNC
jgi:predicted small lipoprotein YifL